MRARAVLARLVVAAGILCGAAAIVQADTYPERPIRLIAPYTPGSPNDVMARLLAQDLQARLGQLRQRLSKLSSVDVAQIPADKVGLGSRVTVEDERTGSRETYNMLLADSADFEDGSVSMGSPIGRALLGKGLGETAVLKLPASVRRLKVVELQTIHQQ